MKTEALNHLAKEAKGASQKLSLVSTDTKNKALQAMSKALWNNRNFILRENVKDLEQAKQRGISGSVLARLSLDEVKVKKIADSLIQISKLKDPVGDVLSKTRRPNGLLIQKIRVPIGVILIIYEARPNVTADCMALCLKSGNAVILKGGSESLNSNKAIFKVLSDAAISKGIPKGSFQFIDTTDREAVKYLLGLDEWINLVIPRGGESLIREVAALSRIPVIKHYKGVCHVYVDERADLKKALAITLNAKAQNPSVCNAMETLLVSEKIYKKFLPEAAKLLQSKQVELRGDAKTLSVLSGIQKASEEDWYAEYLDLILAVRVVRNVDEAIMHIQKYGSAHSDSIVTEDKKTAEKFCREVDSACVFVNASTRFNDGGEFGMGAEMGISTDKLHARGPMGLEELTSYKYIVQGNGQIRG